MNESEEKVRKPVVQSRGRMMDFAPRNANAPRPVRKTVNLNDDEQRRREIARREIARREEIHRQIERQKEEDLLAERRALAARRDLSRRLEVEREENEEAIAEHEKELRLQQEREERARKRAMIEARALKERQRILAERRAKRAREELEQRRRAESLMRHASGPEIRNPRGSKDPLARQIIPEEPEEEPEEIEEVEEVVERREETPKRSLFSRREKVEKRLGSVEDFEKDLDALENSEEEYDEKLAERAIDAFVKDEKDDYLDDIDEIEKKVEEAEEDTSRNNDRYVLGGRSPFINTAVEKRPLSGGNKTFESTASAASYNQAQARPARKLGQQKLQKKPVARGRYVPYEEPIPHKNIYARTVEKEKRIKDVPTMVVGETSTGSKASLIIAILLTVVLGAAVGAIAYLALFQQEENETICR